MRKVRWHRPSGEGTGISEIRTLLPRLRHPVHLLALGFGSGLSPRAPGTLGSLVALLLFALLALLMPADWVREVLVIVAVLACVAGVPICGYSSRAMGGGDHAAIVWDEFAGLWVALMWLPLTLGWWLAAFVLFRLFDILKPWPIGWCDKNLKGGLGIMADDILAGLFSALLLLFLDYLLF